MPLSTSTASINRGRKSLRETLAIVLAPSDACLPVCLKQTLRLLQERYTRTAEQLKAVAAEKAALVKQLAPCKRLMDLEGVGTVCASMLHASLGEGSEFKNGRQASVYVGLTPKQYSSGGKVTMLGINKKGGNKELSALPGGLVRYFSATQRTENG